MAVKSEKNKHLRGMRILDIAEQQGKHPIAAAIDLLVEEEGQVLAYISLGEPEDPLSIRTIRLRDPSGSVHTVPFSDVGTVLNYTCDFSNVLLNIGIAYRENVDDVMLVIEEVGRTMAEDATLGANILSPLVTQGVQNMDDSAVIIRARMQVKAGTQWGLKRELNRRIKNRFDELGIEIPFPQRTITFAPETSTKDTGPLKPPARPAEPVSGPVKSRNTDKSGDDGGDAGGEGGG